MWYVLRSVERSRALSKTSLHWLLPSFPFSRAVNCSRGKISLTLSKGGKATSRTTQANSLILPKGISIHQPNCYFFFSGSFFLSTLLQNIYPSGEALRDPHWGKYDFRIVSVTHFPTHSHFPEEPVGHDIDFFFFWHELGFANVWNVRDLQSVAFSPSQWPVTDLSRA